MSERQMLSQIYNATTMMEWERAKGGLRAVVAGLGAVTSTSEPKFEAMNNVVEAFIKDVEDNEYHMLP